MDNTSLLLTVGGAVCTTLVAAVGSLWKDHRDSKKRSEENHLRCEEQHHSTRAELLNVTREVGELKGKVHIAQEIGSKLDELKDAVINNTNK